jgi:hypothetical protein
VNSPQSKTLLKQAFLAGLKDGLDSQETECLVPSYWRSQIDCAPKYEEGFKAGSQRNFLLRAAGKNGGSL